VPRIGNVPINAPARDTNDPEFQALLSGLRDYGYVDGQNIQVEYRFPKDASRYSDMVNELFEPRRGCATDTGNRHHSGGTIRDIDSADCGHCRR
jgi:hypothetical protein